MNESSSGLFSKKVLFLCILFIGFVIGLECVFRTTHIFGARLPWKRLDAEVGWRFVPNRLYWQESENDHPISGRINSHGWRDVERSLDKPPGTYRIAVIGDSMVEGMQVELENTFLRLAERRLKARGMEVELLNFGVFGYAQAQELIVLRKDVIRFSPNFVMLFFYPPNDIAAAAGDTTLSRFRPYFTVAGDGSLRLDTAFSRTADFKFFNVLSPLIERAALLALIANSYFSARSEVRMEFAGGGEAPNRSGYGRKIRGYLSLATEHPEPVYVRSYEVTKRLIEEMARFCAMKGVQFMLVCINSEAYVPEIERKYRAMDPSFDAHYFEADLRAFSDSLGIPYLGLQRAFRMSYEKTGIPLQWSHWNYEGHELVARLLTDVLESHILSGEGNT